MRSSDQVRYQLSLPKSASERFEQVAAAPGAPKSKLLTAAVDAWPNRRGTDDLEQRFAARLDRLSNQLGRIERDSELMLESLGLFIRYMLTLNAPPAEEDEVARAIGRDRFAAFVKRVGQRLASSRRTLQPGQAR
jgi:hypothetical protein